MLFVIALFLLLSPIHVLAQSLSLSETWPAYEPNGNERWEENGGCYSYSFSVVPDPCGGSNTVLRVRVTIGDDTSACAAPWNEAAGSACFGPSPYYPKKYRAEVVESGTLGGDNKPDNGQNFWLGWRIYVPEDWPSPNRLNPIVSQILSTVAGEDGSDWILRLNGESWVDEQRTSAANGGGANTYINTTVGTLTRGTWNNFVLHEKRHATAGIHKLWFNGAIKADYTGRTSQDSQNNATWKYGQLKGCMSTSYAGQTYDLYFDDLKTAYGTSDTQNLKSLVEPTVASGACTAAPPPPPTEGPPLGEQLSESCTTNQVAGTNGLVIVPDNQANLETAVETNTSKTILVKEGNYNVDNFQIGAGNVVKPYNCQVAQVIVNGTSNNVISADNWTIAGMRFFCGGLDRDCFQLTDADGWTMRKNHITEIMRGGPHVMGDSTNGTLDGNLIESCPTCVQGNMVTVGDITDPGGVGCTGTPCLFGESPSNITIKNNRFTGHVSPGNSAGGGNHMLAIDGYSRLGLEVYDNVFINPHNFWTAISLSNNWLRSGNALNGSANIHHNTIYGPFTGTSAAGVPSGPAIYLQDAEGCKASNDCPNHRIHHNYIRDSHSIELSTSGTKLSGSFKGHGSRYASATIEHNVDDNNNNIDESSTEAVHALMFRQNTFYISSMRFRSEMCTDTHSGDNFTFTKNATYNTRITDSCTGTPDWLISDNVISSAPATFDPTHLDSGNTTTAISFGNVTQGSEDFTITTASESQKGALPVPTISSATIGDDCVLNINMSPFNANGHNHGPMSAFGWTRVTPKYNGVIQTISSGNISGNTLKASMAACPPEGVVVTFDTSYGWCRDSARIGGNEKAMQAQCLPVTGQSVTNNATGVGPLPNTTFYVDASCGTNGNGTSTTCGATGPWNSLKNALEVAGCAGMAPSDILEVQGDATLDITCEGASTDCYFEDHIEVAQGCSGIIIQNAENEHVILDGSMDIKGSTWTSIGSGVYRCATSGCSGAVGDVFAARAWYDRGAGAEELDLIQSTQTCDTSLAAGKMRINQTDQSICVHLSNNASPSTTSYFRVPWHSPAISGIISNPTNVTIRGNAAGTGSFRIQRYRNNGIELDAPSNAGWSLHRLHISDILNRCISVNGSSAAAGIRLLSNTLSFCGQEAVNFVGDTGVFQIFGNVITDIQTTPDYERCDGVGTGCLSGFSAIGRGIVVQNFDGVSGVIDSNSLLRIGGGHRGRARAIDLVNHTKNITVSDNYIAHMDGLPFLGSAIVVSGSSTTGTHNGNKIINNRIFDTDICFNWVFTGSYPTQAGTTNYLLNNTCSEPAVTGLIGSWTENALLDGKVIVQNNVFSAVNTVPTRLIQLPSTRESGWQSLENNVFECDDCVAAEPCEGCGSKTTIIEWCGKYFASPTDCTAGDDCIEDMGGFLGRGVTNNVYGEINVNIANPPEPSLELTAPSIAIDAGKSVPQVTVDYLGTSRPRGSGYDAGAFESGAAGTTTYVLTQRAFRFFAPRASDGQDPIAPEDTNISVFSTSEFAIRFGIAGSDGDAPSLDLALWARKCTPSCGSWILVNDASDAAVGVYLVDNPVRTNQSAISNQLLIEFSTEEPEDGEILPTPPWPVALTFDPGSKFIDALPNSMQSSINQDYQFEAEFHVRVSSGVSVGNSVELRVEQVDGTDLNSYTSVPKITIAKTRRKHSGGYWR